MYILFVLHSRAVFPVKLVVHVGQLFVGGVDEVHPLGVVEALPLAIDLQEGRGGAGQNETRVVDECCVAASGVSQNSSSWPRSQETKQKTLEMRLNAVRG